MPRTLYAQIGIALPDDQFEAASVLVAFHPMWQTLIDAMNAAGIKHIAKLESVESRTKPGPKGRPQAATRRAHEQQKLRTTEEKPLGYGHDQSAK